MDNDTCTKLTNNQSFVFASSNTEEIKIILHMFITIALQNFCQTLPFAVGNMFIGHLSNAAPYIAGAGLARTFTMMTGTSIAWGMSSGLLTLLPQAIGANHRSKIGIYVQRCIFINVVLLIALSIIQFFGGYVMRLIGQPDELVPIISKYCRVLILYLWGIIAQLICQKIGRALHFNTELFYCNLIGGLSSVPLNFFFVFYCELGYIGTAISIDVSAFIAFFMMIYVLIKNGYGYIFKPLPFSVVVNYRGLQEYLSLSIPGFFMDSLPWWLFEILAILSGYISNPTIAISTTIIVGSINILFVVITEGLYEPITIRVGKYIGAGSVLYAKRAALCGFVLVGTWCCLFVALTLSLRTVLPHLYTDVQEIVDLCSKVIYFLTIRGLSYCIYLNVAGIYRGLGFQKYVAYVMTICHCGIAFSLTLVLLFGFEFRMNLEYGLFSLWGATTLGFVLAAISLIMILMCCIDWKSALEESNTRLKYCVSDYGSTKTDYVSDSK